MRWVVQPLFGNCFKPAILGVENLKDNIWNVTSTKFNHDGQKLTDNLKMNYHEIREKGMDYDDYLTQVY